MNAVLPVIRLVLVDDHAIVRQSLKLYLSQDSRLRIVGEAHHGQEALEVVEREQPDVVLMDLLMPVMDGITATREIHARWPDVQVLALTSALEEHRVNGAIQAGALGYLLKDTCGEDVLDAIQAAARGEVRLSPAAAERLVREFRAPEMREHLTAREVLTLQLIARGLSNAQIAREYGAREQTVKTHVSRLLAKLEVSSRTQAALYALKHGLASL